MPVTSDEYSNDVSLHFLSEAVDFERLRRIKDYDGLITTVFLLFSYCFVVCFPTVFVVALFSLS